MKNNSRFLRFNSAAVLSTALLISGAASAKGHKPQTSSNQAQVVAHVSFAGLSDVDMAIQKKVNDKYYLYVQHSKEQGVSIIDVSKPAEPKIIGAIAWPDPAFPSRMNVTGDLAIIAENDVQRRSSSSDDLVLWDLSDPASPRVVRKFEGVVRWLQDERNFIYVLNAEGLWVVSKPVDSRPTEPESSSNYGG